MEHPKAIGDRTTLAVMQALQTTGYAVSVPFGENVRYDLVIHDGETLRRVQCKTGRLRGEPFASRHAAATDIISARRSPAATTTVRSTVLPFIAPRQTAFI